MRGIKVGMGVLALAASLAAAGSAAAATLEVTKTGDPVPGACTAGDCSLREAVRRANATTASDRIVLKARSYGLAQSGEDDDALAGDLDVTAGSGRLTIVGKAARKTTIDGNDVDRILDVLAGARVSLRRLTLRDGSQAGGGGGIQNLGSVAIREAALRSNNAGYGGGILNAGTGRLTIERTKFGGNEAVGGAGLYNEDEATATLTRAAFSDNDASVSGGGMYNQNDATTRLARTVFRGNQAGGGGGGGFYNQNEATATLTRNVFRGNQTTGGGGAIYSQNEGLLALRKSTIDRNVALGDGGGLYHQNEAPVKVRDSTISRNNASDEGGGIYVRNDVVLALTNSTVSGNRAAQGGGLASDNWPSIRISFSTIARNTATIAGGGVFDGADPPGPSPPAPLLMLKGTLVAKNSAAGVSGNCATGGPGIFDSLGFNVEDADSCGFDRSSDDTNAAAGLRRLARNGGPTKTHALKPGSDAVNAARKQGCPSRDQRGVKRPQGNRCDAGSYELKKN